MIELNDVVAGLESVESKRQEDTRFIGDREVFDNLEEIVEEYKLTDLVAIDGTSEGYIAFNGVDVFVVMIRCSNYQGQKQYSYSIQQLTLQGLWYFSNSIINLDKAKQLLNEIYGKFLKESGINANAQDLSELAVFEPSLNSVYILSFESNDAKYWLTFRELDEGFKALTKITKKLKGIPVKPKIKKLNINII